MRQIWSDLFKGMQSNRPGLLLAGCLIFAPAFAQDMTHPRQMNLPESGFQRPAPDDFRLELANGLVSYVVEDHQVPLVTVTAVIRAGTASGAKEGAAEALARVLSSGSEASGTFAAWRHSSAAGYQFEMGPEITRLSLDVAAEDAAAAVQKLAALLLNPVISDEMIAAMQDRARAAMMETGAVSYDGSLGNAVARFDHLLFTDHPYGKAPSAGDVAGLKAEDVTDFHRRFFVARNATLALAGDFSAEVARGWIRDHFGAWDPGQSTVPAAAAAPRLPKKPQVHTYESDKLQAWVVLGHELPVVPIEEWAALEVMNYILGGGHFDTRLFRVTRDMRGLTNDDSGFLEPNWYGPGHYTFRTYGRPSVVNLLVELTLKEINRIRQEPVSDEEMFVAKNALAEGSFEMWFENGYATALTFAEEWLRYGHHDNSASYVDRVRRVSREDVRRAAQKYLHPERMQLVLMGPIKKVMDSSHPEGTFRVTDFGKMIPGQ